MSGTLKRLKRRGGASLRLAKATFAIAATDCAVDLNPGYQPGNVYLSITRHTTEWSSPHVPWEASLKTPLFGLCLWHPPFQAEVTISLPPTASSSSNQTGGGQSSSDTPHKDVFVSVFACPKKSKAKPKLLAKARIDLLEYRECAEKVNVKLRLFPETKKVKKSHVNLTIVNASRSQAKAEEVAASALIRLGPVSPNAQRKSIEDLVGSTGRSDGISSLSKSLRSLDDVDEDGGVRAESSRASSSLLPPPEPSGRKSIDLSTLVTPAERGRAKSVENILFERSSPERGRKSPSPPLRTLPVPFPVVPPSQPSLSPSSPSQMAGPGSGSPNESESGQVKPVSPPKSLVTPVKSSLPSLEEAFSRSPVEEQSRTPHLFASTPFARNGLRSTTPGRITTGMNDQESEILQWAKSVLKKKYPTVKVTNMTSSWRNGMAYCALIHHRHPDLIDFRKLNGQHAEDNSRLAEKAAELLGVQLPEGKELGSLDKESNAAFLRGLKEALSKRQKFTEDQLEGWRSTLESLEKRRMRPDSSVITLPLSDAVFPSFSNVSSLWPESPGKTAQTQKKEDRNEEALPLEIDKAPREDSVPVPAESPKSPVSATVPPLSTAASAASTEAGPVGNAPGSSSSANRKRVQEMILSAHQERNLYRLRRKLYNEVANLMQESSPEEEHVPSPSAAASDLAKIREELRDLEIQMDHTDREKSRLEGLLRNSSIDEPSAIESLILVQNERNSLLREQMVLNLKEKEAVIATRQERIREEIQQLADIDPERKTEALRDREQALIDQHLQLVNERNELVLQLDSQEQAIQEDEDIRQRFQSGKISFRAGEDSLRGVFNKFSDALKKF